MIKVSFRLLKLLSIKIFLDILYNFKKWLQIYNSVPLLNYVHAFEDFNRRFFAKTELNKAEIDSFHRELSQIIDDYFSATSRSRIPVKNKINQGGPPTYTPKRGILRIFSELKTILFERNKNVFNTEIAIQASKPLTIAYNTALSLLEEYYIPDFCHDVYSNDSNLTCGNSAGDIVGPRDAYNRSERSSLKTGSISRSSSLMFSTGSRKPSIKMPVKSKETENLPMIGRGQNILELCHVMRIITIP